jgi:NAD(P)-dependent dehydrogenase (short-subunit alcohol dehydrogenase family)
MTWTTAEIPDQRGRVALVTGATSGLGELTARVLAARGARVVLAARDEQRTEATTRRILRDHPSAHVDHVPLDLADLASVATAAALVRERYDRLDLLIANAGVMATPLQRTADGFEWQLGVNHLGHQALVADLLGLVLATPRARIVLVSSLMHRYGRLDLDDPCWEYRPYRRWGAYSASKLANLAYMFELRRRIDSTGVDTTVAGAHPGYSRTGLQTAGPTASGGIKGAVTGVMAAVGNHLIAQPPQTGVLPQLYAATAAEVGTGSYWGPRGPGELRGEVAAAAASARARDAELGRELWEVSERLTGVRHRLDDGQGAAPDRAQ